MNSCYFIKVHNGKLILWDYLNQRQYEVGSDHVSRLLALSQDSKFGEVQIDNELAGAGLLESDIDAASGWRGGMLSRLFHFGTQVILADGQHAPEPSTEEAYIDWSTQIAEHPVPLTLKHEGAIYELPAPSVADFNNSSLWEVLQGRRTSRDFSGESVSLQQIANVMFATFGFIHGEGRPEMLTGGFLPLGNRRSSPSAGSLQTTEPYLISLSIDGLPRGIFHYRSESHQLVQLDVVFEPEMLAGLLGGQEHASELSFGVLLTSRFDRIFWKYPSDRAYRMMLTDLGCLAQTFQLACTASHLESWMTGCLFEREFNRILSFDESNESAMFFLGAGHGSGLPFSRVAREIASKRDH
jgi:SagB-type dehydrogenase family enzyme